VKIHYTASLSRSPSRHTLITFWDLWIEAPSLSCTTPPERGLSFHMGNMTLQWVPSDSGADTVMIMICARMSESADSQQPGLRFFAAFNRSPCAQVSGWPEQWHLQQSCPNCCQQHAHGKLCVLRAHAARAAYEAVRPVPAAFATIDGLVRSVREATRLASGASAGRQLGRRLCLRRDQKAHCDAVTHRRGGRRCGRRRWRLSCQSFLGW